jgi:hypothetical protein
MIVLMLGAINSATQCNAMLPASAMLCCHSMQSYAATESIQNIIHAEGVRGAFASSTPKACKREQIQRSLRDRHV